MAAEETALEGSVPVDGASGRAEKARRDARRIERWSIAWMLLAMAVWGFFVFLMVADYGPETPSHRGSSSLCRGPLVEPWPGSMTCRDAELRQWPALLGILALAVVSTVLAAATTVYAKVLSRLAPGGELVVEQQGRT
ncbi:MULTISPECIES: hypothetical protein [unclassified Streptomyces]|uniref:hypothetical protein n=1 Tax=unclassified Streptomyces TaxID=2593676 RepID=UPI002E28246A|nr:hypothetical protein [Streptomyces sp. NBC_01439]